MKTTLRASLLTLCLSISLAASTLHAQTNSPGMPAFPTPEQEVQSVLANETTNQFFLASNEVVVEIGGAYAQNTGQAGSTLDIARFGLIGGNQDFAIGGQMVNGVTKGQQGIIAAFAYGEYRKAVNNIYVAGKFGAGYDNENNSPMGIGALELGYRTSSRLGVYLGYGWAFEGRKDDRGQILEAGASYGF